MRGIAVALVLTLSSAGKSLAADRLTLADALARAARNPSVAAAAARVEAAGAHVREARAGRLPRVDVTEGWQRTDQPVLAFGALLSQRRFEAADFAIDALNHPSPISNYHVAFAAEQPLYDAGRTSAAVSTATLAEDALRAGQDDALSSIRLAALRAYVQASAEAAMVTAATAARGAAGEDLIRVMRRRDLGLETDAAVLAAQVRDDETAAAQVAAEGDEEIARATLNGIIGAPLDTSFALDAPIPADAPLPDVAAAENAALTRPDVRRARFAEKSAEAARSGSRHAFLPDVAATGMFQADGATFQDRASAWTAGIQLRWNVFAGGADTARLAAADASVRAAGAELSAAETAARLDVRRALVAARTAAGRERLTRRSVEEARESQRILRQRYEAGLATAADLLRAGEVLARAEAERVGALADLRVVLASLDYAMGKEILP